MTNKAIFKVFLLSSFLFLSGCSKVVEQKDLYTFHSAYSGPSIPRNIKIETSENGILKIVSLDDKSSVPVGNSLETEGVEYYPDAPGAQNVLISINPQVGYTSYAGLRFAREVRAGIPYNGIVQIDRANVVVSDNMGFSWISKRVKLGSSRFIGFIRN